MRSVFASWMLAAVLASVAGPTQAAVISLVDYGFNINGSVALPTLGDPVPGQADVTAFDPASGLGTISVGFSSAGAHSVALFIDHEIDQLINTFFNENGAAVNAGALGAGQSWEIDEPGFLFGDIFDNFAPSSGGNATLDNSNTLPAGSEDDVSMAIAWDFVLNLGDSAVVDFVLSDTNPDPLGSGNPFYLVHSDPDSAASIYFSSALTITRAPPAGVPEPGMSVLLGLGLLGMGAGHRLRMR